MPCRPGASAKARGIADRDSGVSGWASWVNEGVSDNLTVTSWTHGAGALPTTATSEVQITDSSANPVFRVTQDVHPVD